MCLLCVWGYWKCLFFQNLNFQDVWVSVWFQIDVLGCPPLPPPPPLRGPSDTNRGPSDTPGGGREGGEGDTPKHKFGIKRILTNLEHVIFENLNMSKILKHTQFDQTTQNIKIQTSQTYWTCHFWKFKHPKILRKTQTLVRNTSFENPNIQQIMNMYFLKM